MRLTSNQFERILLTLTRQAGRGGGEDHRTDPRVPADGIVLLIPEDADDVPIHARLRDISRGGVGFSHHSGLPRGRRMTLHLPAGTGEQPDPVRCEVRHCEQTGENAFLIGVSFLA